MGIRVIFGEGGVYFAGTGTVTVAEPPVPHTVPETEPPWVPTVAEPDDWTGPAQAATMVTINTQKIALILLSSHEQTKPAPLSIVLHYNCLVTVPLLHSYSEDYRNPVKSHRFGFQK